MAYNMRDDIKEVYFTEEQLRDKVRELGARITEDYRGKNPLIVSVLKGSYIFMSDLTRAIDTPCNVDFMVVSSYGNGTKTSGEVQIIKDIAQPIDGRDLLTVEDILASGVTLHYLMQILAARGANSIRLCTLGRAILSESSLSFLGVGIRTPQASWGNLIQYAASLPVLTGRPWVWVPPGLCIILTVLCLQGIGDGLRDALDPRYGGHRGK